MAAPGGQMKVSSATNRCVPEGLETALISARQKYEQGKPLGFEMSDIIADNPIMFGSRPN